MSSNVYWYRADGSVSSSAFGALLYDGLELAKEVQQHFSGVGSRTHHRPIVVVALPNSFALIAAILGLRAAGAIAVLADPLLPHDAITRLCTRVGADFLIYADHGLIPVTTDPVIDFPAGVTTVLMSSGSTGEPTLVCLDDANWTRQARTLIAHYHYTPKDVHFSPMPIFHCNAYGQSFWLSYLLGCDYVLLERFDPQSAAQAIGEMTPTILSFAPIMLQRLLHEYATWRPPASVRAIITAAAPLPQELVHRSIADWQLPITQGYGQVELTNFTCLMPHVFQRPGDTGAAAHYGQIMCPYGSVGPALPGIEIQLADRDGIEIPHDQEAVEGQLFVRSPYASLGVIADGQAQPLDVYHPTGDLGYWRWQTVNGRRQRYYYLIGRLKESIKRGGETIAPGQVEELLVAGGFNPAGICVVGIDDADLGQEIGLVVEQGLTDAQLDVLAQLPKKFRPKQIALGAIPRTASGKVQRWKARPLFKPRSSTPAR